MRTWTGRLYLASLRWYLAFGLSLGYCFGGIEAISNLSAAGTGESWYTLARTACIQEGCDGELLIAIALSEQDKRGSESIHDNGVGFGRFGMKVTTAGRYVLGTTDTGRMTAAQYLMVGNMLRDDLIAATWAAKELARCGRRNKTTRSRLRCWNNSTVYADKVLAVYRKRLITQR